MTNKLQFHVLYTWAYYAFEQYSEIFPIMPQLCSTVPNHVRFIMLQILLNESEDKYTSLNYIYFTAVESTKLYNQHIN